MGAVSEDSAPVVSWARLLPPVGRQGRGARSEAWDTLPELLLPPWKWTPRPCRLHHQVGDMGGGTHCPAAPPPPAGTCWVRSPRRNWRSGCAQMAAGSCTCRA